MLMKWNGMGISCYSINKDTEHMQFLVLYVRSPLGFIFEGSRFVTEAFLLGWRMH